MIFEQTCEICGTKVVFDHEQIGYEHPCRECRILSTLGTEEQRLLATKATLKGPLLAIVYVSSAIFAIWGILLCFLSFENSLVWLLVGLALLAKPILDFREHNDSTQDMYDFRMKLSLTCPACGARTAQSYWITPKETTCPVCHDRFQTPWGKRS